MTVDQRIAQISEASGVISAFMEREEAITNANLYLITIRWYYLKDGIALRDEAQLIVLNRTSQDPESPETAYWFVRTPSILVVPTEVKYLTSRTAGGWASLSGSAQKAAIENFCNEVYKAANAGAANIREFSAEPINGTTVKVRGNFNTKDANNAFNQWTPMVWYVRLIDANGSVATPYSNVEFHKVIE